MGKKILGAALAVVVVLSMAQVAGAQAPPQGGPFGHRGHEGPGGGGPSGMMGGQRGCIATAAVPCPAYQFTFTITSTEPVLVNGSPSTITKTTTGIIAADTNGSTYRDVKSSGMGPWASLGGAAEFIFIKNLDPAVMMNYVVNVTKNTYEQFAIRTRSPLPNWEGKGRRNGERFGTPPTPTVVDDKSSGYDCTDAEKTTITHTVQLPGVSGTTEITTNRVYCPELKVVIKEDHSDPRFGTRTYQLSGYMPTPHVSFAPPFGLSPAPTLVEKKNFRHGKGPKGEFSQPPAQP